jgi:hypothetical protein
MVIALAGFVTFGALPAAANSDNVQYVALGDSYAAGVGAGSYDGTDCVQSSNGYPELLDSGRRIDLRDVLVSNRHRRGRMPQSVKVGHFPPWWRLPSADQE